MLIFGLDFTSAPSPRKPITCAICELYEATLLVKDTLALATFAAFEAFLHQNGPWVAAFDFPFGQPRKLLANLNWPQTWEGYVQHCAALGKTAFEETLTQYQASRPAGNKQHTRVIDKLAGARSPMMLYRVPVGKMFFQGAPRLLQADVSILPCRPKKTNIIALEGYPALVAQRWAGKVGYKSDERKKQTPEQHSARQRIVDGIRSDELRKIYAVSIELSDTMANRLVQEPMGDELDAVLCAIQAAWAYIQREQNYGIPPTCDAVEGWIVDPAILERFAINSSVGA
ncbi:MAG: hypothetical protein NVS4B12_03140 [Ktedonobacteraceae bacterium]